MRRFFPLFAALLGATMFAAFALSSPAQAITGSEWTAGSIIDDGVFTDSSSMTYSEIQWFLMSKMTNCDTYGAGTVDGVSRASYAANKGNPQPTGKQVFTCLKDYYEVPKTTTGPAIPANNYGYPSGNIPSGAKSAAQLILEAAQAYNISPRVLLVTLQKEQGLVSDDWPLNSQYMFAMGAHCPDGPNGADCDSNYAGFSLQMRESAKLFRSYLDNMTQPWWTYKKPYKVNNILWNVTKSNCGGTDVYIENMATAALYTYTPYQPNGPALSNLYGTGDRCSAYGNRNFWRLFNDWFGTTKGNLFNATTLGQSAYPEIAPGESKTVNIRYRNSGQWTWHDSTVNWPGVPPIYLAAATGASPFSYGWPSSNVAMTSFSKVYEPNGTTLAANQHQASPGQVVEFSFPVSAPWTIGIGSYGQLFKPVVAGTKIDLSANSEVRMDVNIPTYFSASLSNQSTYPEIAPGETTNITLRYQNSGQWTWHDDGTSWPNMPSMYLTTSDPTFFSYGWPSNRIAAKNFSKVYEADGVTLASNQHIVNRYQFVEYTIPITAPWSADAGSYALYFSPKLGGETGLSGTPGSKMVVNIPYWRASNVGQSAYPSLAPGQGKPVFVRFKNTGAWTWRDSTVNWPGLPAVQLETTVPTAGNSIFAYGWPNGNTASRTFTKVYESNGSTLASDQHITKPGQIAEFGFNMTAPWSATVGNYPHYFKPRLSSGADIDFGSNSLTRIDANVQ